MEIEMSTSKIPQTDSIRDLAHFWDHHDITDFEDELEEVKERVFDRSESLRVHFQPNEVEAVKQLAKSKGVSYDHLIREWVLEKLGLL